MCVYCLLVIINLKKIFSLSFSNGLHEEPQSPLGGSAPLETYGLDLYIYNYINFQEYPEIWTWKVEYMLCYFRLK